MALGECELLWVCLTWSDNVVVCAEGDDEAFAVEMAEEVSVRPLMSFREGVSWDEGVYLIVQVV